MATPAVHHGYSQLGVLLVPGVSVCVHVSVCVCVMERCGWTILIRSVQCNIATKSHKRLTSEANNFINGPDTDHPISFMRT